MMGVRIIVLLLQKSILTEMRELHLSKEKTMGEWVLVAIVLLIISLNQGGGRGGGIQILERSPSKSVEYIHFLDSDDWLELDCIEKCVDITLSFQAQIVWHGCKHFYEATQEIKESDFPKQLGLEENQVYSGLEIFSKLPFPSFSWVAMGIIKSDLVYQTRFEEGIESEDAIFGMQTFALAQKICLIFDNFYNYRIRPNSASQHTLKNKNAQGISFPPHQRDIVEAFGDIFTIRHYRFAYSCAIISLRMDEFIQKESLSSEVKEILKSMIEERVIYAFGGLSFERDPKNIREICSKLLDYTSRVRWSSKLAYYFPRVFRILKKLKTMIIKIIREQERATPPPPPHLF